MTTPEKREDVEGLIAVARNEAAKLAGSRRPFEAAFDGPTALSLLEELRQAQEGRDEAHAEISRLGKEITALKEAAYGED